MLPVVSVREITPAISQIHSFKFGLNHWILNKHDYGPKRQIQDDAGSSMHNIAEKFDSESNMDIKKSAKRLTLNREP
ncbi:MAG: hypothetical protein JRJ02_14805 [Deltaproteobacteria bacterium]|nr:hypothetical protein [Deltaproteobacteria bacterium]